MQLQRQLRRATAAQRIGKAAQNFPNRAEIRKTNEVL